MELMIIYITYLRKWNNIKVIRLLKLILYVELRCDNSLMKNDYFNGSDYMNEVLKKGTDNDVT